MTRKNLIALATILLCAACVRSWVYPPSDGNYLYIYEDYLKNPPHDEATLDKDHAFAKLRSSSVPTPKDAELRAIAYFLANRAPIRSARGKAAALLATPDDMHFTWKIAVFKAEGSSTGLPAAYVFITADGTETIQDIP